MTFLEFAILLMKVGGLLPPMTACDMARGDEFHRFIAARVGGDADAVLMIETPARLLYCILQISLLFVP